jgi:hypothetical protein
MAVDKRCKDYQWNVNLARQPVTPPTSGQAGQSFEEWKATNPTFDSHWALAAKAWNAALATQDARIEAAAKCLNDGARMVESAYVHVSHGGPTREEASLWVARADEILRSLGRKVEP